jgi:metallo-beta-lactamase family protein
MCTAGRILNHLFYGLENYNNTILLVGYASENTLARQLMDGAEYVNINMKELLVKANVATIGAFSAHADYNEMLDWLSGIDKSKLKGIYLVHGSPESLNAMQELLISRGYPRVNIVQEGIEYKLN